jgi:uncharacterized protein
MLETKNISSLGEPRIASKIKRQLLSLAQSIQVQEVRIGLHYTMVQLEDGWSGMALTWLDGKGGCCEEPQDYKPLSGRPASELLSFLSLSDRSKRSLGFACANALSNRTDPNRLSGDVLDALDLKKEDHVGMIGHFVPMVDNLRTRVGALTIFERVEKQEGEILPSAEAREILPRCQVVLITATALINDTLDDLLPFTQGCREVVVLGPSTPMWTQAFAGTPVTMLSGVVISEPAPVLKAISEGGGMRAFGPFIQKVNLRLPKTG